MPRPSKATAALRQNIRQATVSRVNFGDQLKRENAQLKNQIQILETEANLKREEFREVQEKVTLLGQEIEELHYEIEVWQEKVKQTVTELDECRMEMQLMKKNQEEKNTIAENDRKTQEELHLNEISKKDQFISSLELKMNDIVLQTPSRGMKLKAYDKLQTQEARDEQCQRVLQAICRFVQQHNLDQFATELQFDFRHRRIVARHRNLNRKLTLSIAFP
uniref:Uncharacterized protein n=1 Tax=Caenorhabditis japonica TaxID=281687 RepID=A0A8R1I444_CAEJA